MTLEEFGETYFRFAMPVLLIMSPALASFLVLHPEFPTEVRTPFGFTFVMFVLLICFISFWYCWKRLGWFSGPGNTPRLFIVIAAIVWVSTAGFHFKVHRNKNLCEAQGGTWTARRACQMPK